MSWPAFPPGNLSVAQLPTAYLPTTACALYKKPPLPPSTYLLVYARGPRRLTFPAMDGAREIVEHGIRSLRRRSVGKEKRRLVKSVFLEIAQAYHCLLEGEKKRG